MHLYTSILVAIMALTGSASAFPSSDYGLHARDFHDNIDLYGRDAYLDERDAYNGNFYTRDIYLDERDIYDDIYARDLELLERGLAMNKASLSRRAPHLEHGLYARKVPMARPNLGNSRLTPMTMGQTNMAVPHPIPFIGNGVPVPHVNIPQTPYFLPGQPQYNRHLAWTSTRGVDQR